MSTYDTFVEEPLVSKNSFITCVPKQQAIPSFTEIRDKLPQPLLVGSDPLTQCYWKAWELAFANLKQPAKGSGFVSSYLDSAFNDCLFMWDSAFNVMFGRYARRAFDIQQTLDNFYAKQQPDGFICREIRCEDGKAMFERFDPASTGPNILAWAEWDYFEQTQDSARLEAVFAPLVAYYRWFRRYRSWPDGSYWSCGWGCGMDNQPRLPSVSDNVNFEHAQMSWVDTTLQQLLSAKLLLKIAGVLGRVEELSDIEVEAGELTEFVNKKMWSDELDFYVDRFKDGSLSTVKTIGAYWALFADIVPENRLVSFLSHLENDKEFARPNPVPTLSADNPEYDPAGGYWRA